MAGSPGSPGAADSKKGVKRAPLRSSIACQRCRKSKIKCNNTGGDQPCETCIRNGKECTYPEVTPAPPKRSEPPTGAKIEQGSERKRLRRIEDIVRMEGAVPGALVAEDVLSASYLTETVWGQLFDYYKLHFSTELPFLHVATYKEHVRNRFKAKPAETSPEINLVLLGILTLTARFHKPLVQYTTGIKNNSAVSGMPKPRPTGPASDASIASEYYADVLTKALGGLRTSMTVASVERVQAFLMLGLYEWSQARPRVGGMAAWMYVGVAIRMAQALGLGDGDKKPNKIFRSRPIKPAQQPMTITAREIRRRTMFSCLILDRLLGCGKDRVSTIRSEDLQIQLPCEENSFNFDLSSDVYTGFLKPTQGVDNTRPISDSVNGRFVRLVDLWGEISKWSFSGGRFTEDHPPWSPESTFFQLREKLEAFYEDFLDRFKWSESNYYRHENNQDGSVYVSLHMLGSVCTIMLHREYIPFIPILCDKPVGPLDEPTFAPGQEPQGFWEASAEEIFRAARDIVDLAEICGNKLPMSSLVLFAVWTAAFVGIYAFHFPHIDTRGHMLPREEINEPLDVAKHGPTGLTCKLLTNMSHYGGLKLAETYVSYFGEMSRYYDTVKQDYERHIGNRVGGGGLEEWKERAFKVVNNGEILVLDEGKSSSRDSTVEPGSSVGPDSSHPTDHAKTPRSTSMSFTPINNAQPHPGQPDSASEAAAETLWRIQQPHGQHSQHSQHQQQQHSPSQSSGAVPSPQMPQHAPHMGFAGLPKLPPNESGEGLEQYLEDNQSLAWHLVPGGPGQFSLGTEDMGFPENGASWFYGGVSEAWPAGVLPQHAAGGYY